MSLANRAARATSLVAARHRRSDRDDAGPDSVAAADNPESGPHTSQRLRRTDRFRESSAEQAADLNPQLEAHPIASPGPGAAVDQTLHSEGTPIASLGPGLRASRNIAEELHHQATKDMADPTGVTPHARRQHHGARHDHDCQPQRSAITEYRRGGAPGARLPVPMAATGAVGE